MLNQGVENVKGPLGVRILLTGGGTGGHVGPALAVTQVIRLAASESYWQPLFLYIGSTGGVEQRMSQSARIDFVGVQSGKLRRASTSLGYLTLQNFLDLFRVPVGIFQSLYQVWRFKPMVAFGTGGYVAVPTIVACWLLRVPILIHEQTAQLGLANRICAYFANRIALSFEQAVERLPRRFRQTAVVTGNPLRAVVFAGDRNRAISRFGFSANDNSLPTVYVTGGARGARAINRAIETVLAELLTFCRVIHQCGAQSDAEGSDYDRLHAKAENLPLELKSRYFLTEFMDEEIGDAYALADVVIGRSGAGTLAELAALGKPAIFIPLVPTGGDEQNLNASLAAKRGAAIVLPGSELTGPRLLEELRDLVQDLARLEQMRTAALSMARPDAAEALGKSLLVLAGVNSSHEP